MVDEGEAEKLDTDCLTDILDAIEKLQRERVQNERVFLCGKIRFFIDLKGLRFLKLKLSTFCCIIIVKYGLNKRFLWSILN